MAKAGLTQSLADSTRDGVDENGRSGRRAQQFCLRNDTSATSNGCEGMMHEARFHKLGSARCTVLLVRTTHMLVLSIDLLLEINPSSISFTSSAMVRST